VYELIVRWSRHAPSQSCVERPTYWPTCLFYRVRNSVIASNDKSRICRWHHWPRSELYLAALIAISRLVRKILFQAIERILWRAFICQNNFTNLSYLFLWISW